MGRSLKQQNQAPAWGRIFLLAGSIAILCLLLFSGCAQVPKQSVELSTTVGRDIVQMHKAHRDLAVLLYGRIKNDVNEFVDEVYAPYQIQKLLKEEFDNINKEDVISLFSTINEAVNQPDNADAQKNALAVMRVFIEVLRDDIESYREEKLAPVFAQEEELLSAIDRSYNQIIYANSIVTGHLASIVKVHDAQEKLLREFGIEGLRKKVGEKLANTSDRVATLVKRAKGIDTTAADIEDNIKKLGDQLEGFLKEEEEKKD